MALFYVVAGIIHFLGPQFYRPIIPSWVPCHDPVIYISGVLEIVFGILLLIPTIRNLAAWAIIILLIVIFPANVQMMLNYLHGHNPLLWVAILRLPFQILLIWWAYNTRKPMNTQLSSACHPPMFLIL